MLQERLQKEPKETIYDFFKEVCETYEEYRYLKNKVDSVVLTRIKNPGVIFIDARGCNLEDEIKNAKPDPNAYKYLLWNTFARPYFAKYVYLPRDPRLGRLSISRRTRDLSEEEIKNRQALIKRIFRKKFLWIFR